ncbi:MAG: DNA repair protein RadC [Betaproteobacteria bacterium]|nr:DNA repair protein RadC [Betaproteobacteria bacterium]
MRALTRIRSFSMKSSPALLSNPELLGLVFGIRSDYSAYRKSLKPLFDGSEGRLQQKCAAARELVTRWMRESLREGNLLSDPEAVRDYLGLHFSGREHEAFMVLYLDAQNRLLDAEELFRGTLTQTAVYPREILKSAMRYNAAGVIFAHNHPSGMAKPSTADRQLTETLQKALALVDIKVLDHFIVAGNALVSFAERGWL